jgi:hypothetical protein
VFICTSCNQQAKQDLQDIPEEDIVFIGNDTIWLYIQSQSVHVRRKPELLSEPLGVLHYGDSVYGYYIQDSVWFQFSKDGESAFLKAEYLTPFLVPQKDTMITLADVKRELQRHFSKANVNFKDGELYYPHKTHTVTIPKNIKTIELGNIVYPELRKLNRDFGFGGVRLCTDMSADKSALYTSTARKGTKMTFYSLGALNMQLSDVWDSTSTSLPARIINGDVTFIKGEIK